jgi:hypothetical protein
MPSEKARDCGLFSASPRGGGYSTKANSSSKSASDKESSLSQKKRMLLSSGDNGFKFVEMPCSASAKWVADRMNDSLGKRTSVSETRSWPEK